MDELDRLLVKWAYAFEEDKAYSCSASFEKLEKAKKELVDYLKLKGFAPC